MSLLCPCDSDIRRIKKMVELRLQLKVSGIRVLVLRFYVSTMTYIFYDILRTFDTSKAL